MQVTVENLSGLTRKMTIVLPPDLVSKKMEDAYKELGSEVSIKGFRKGKVPRQILEKNYKQKVQQEVGDKLVQETYFDALEEVKIDAVVHPEIRSANFDEAGSFTYEAEIDVRPEFELTAYKGVEVDHDQVVVSDLEVNEEIERIRREMAPLRTVEDRGAKETDIVIIDFKGYHEGEPLSQVGSENYTLDVGTGRNGKEFEELVIGLKKGEKTSKEIDFPPEFPNPVLAGNKIEFKITIKDIKERVLADLDDEFAKDVNEEFKNFEDLKKHIHENLLQKKQEMREGDLSDKIMMKILDSHDFEVPSRLVAFEVNELIKELENNLKAQGLTIESAGMKTEDLVKQYKESAEKRVKGDFILKAVAEKESIKLEDEDISKGFERIAEKYGMTVDEVKKYFKRREDLMPFMNELLTEKILKFLIAEAKINYVMPQPAEEAPAEAPQAGEKS